MRMQCRGRRDLGRARRPVDALILDHRMDSIAFDGKRNRGAVVAVGPLVSAGSRVFMATFIEGIGWAVGAMAAVAS